MAAAPRTYGRPTMVRAGVLAVFLAALLASSASAAPGVLDPGWASGGVYTSTTFSQQGDDLEHVAVDAQGRTLLAETRDTAEQGAFTGNVVVVERLTSAGALDTTFNPTGATPGKLTIDFNADVGSGAYEYARGIAPGPGGTLVVLAGISTSGGGSQIGLARLLADGSPDTSLDGDGRLEATFSGNPTEYNPVPEALLVDGSGRMLVAGEETFTNANNRGFVARFTAAGPLDTTWDGDGIAAYGGTAPGATSVQLHAITPATGGGVLAGGQSDLDGLVLALGPTGAPVAGFGSGGVATSDFAKGPGFAIASGFAVGVDSRGRVLLGGQMTPASGNARGTIVRFSAAGTPDGGWGTGAPATGVVFLTTPAYARVSGLLVASDDRVVAGGIGTADPDGPGGNGPQNAPSIARLLATGSLDTAFGSGGVTTTAVGTYANGYGLAADSAAARMLQVGYRTLLAPPYDVRAIVLAYTDDGATSPPPPPPPVTTTTTTTAAAAATPASPVTTTKPPPAPAAPKPAPLTFAQSVTLPSAKRCASRRAFAIRLRVPKGAAVTQAIVLVNGKQVAVRKGARLRSTVNLRSLPKGRFTVRITLRLAGGGTLVGKRAYRTCTAKRKGGKPKL
jgi:uncharacterized delta-60 repeat protein